MSLVPARPSPIAPGYKLDRYELICPIAEGGMASVWIARQTGKHGFRRLVAVKTILPKYAAEPKFQRMFIDEARIASRIEHANVTQIVDVGEQHEVTYLVMEYVDGDALSKVHRAAEKKEQKIPVGVLLRVMADVCGGLHAAHELRDEKGVPLGVVHRDVSPQNVLVTTQGVAKLIDFGIAKARDRVGADTNVDQLKGKVAYMAPEQAVGRPTDRRADVWAVGAVLYHLLSGKPPFQGDNDIQTIFALSSGRPPVPLPPSVHPAVAAVVKRALSNAPDARYATAALLQQALEDAMVQAGVVTSTAVVAQYLAETVGDKAAKRKEAIAIGLSAAHDRERVAEIMRSNADHTGVPSSFPTHAATVVDGPAALGASPSDSPASATGQTFAAGGVEVTPLLERRRGRAVVLGGAIAALGVVATVVAFTLRSPGTPAPATAPPPVAAVLPAAAQGEPATAPPSPSAPEPAASESSAPANGAPAPSATPAPRRAPVRWAPARPAGTGKPRVNDGF